MMLVFILNLALLVILAFISTLFFHTFFYNSGFAFHTSSTANVSMPIFQTPSTANATLPEEQESNTTETAASQQESSGIFRSSASIPIETAREIYVRTDHSLQALREGNTTETQNQLNLIREKLSSIIFGNSSGPQKQEPITTQLLADESSGENTLDSTQKDLFITSPDKQSEQNIGNGKSLKNNVTP
jgi:hypothetical protein